MSRRFESRLSLIQLILGILLSPLSNVMQSRDITKTNNSDKWFPMCLLFALYKFYIIDRLLSRPYRNLFTNIVQRTVQMVTLFDCLTVIPTKLEYWIYWINSWGKEKEKKKQTEKKNVSILLTHFKQCFICFTHRIKVCVSLLLSMDDNLCMGE